MELDQTGLPLVLDRCEFVLVFKPTQISGSAPSDSCSDEAAPDKNKTLLFYKKLIDSR